MTTNDFDYYLPDELIAQTPLEKRDSSRLLVLDKNTGEVEHKHFYDILDLLNPGDTLVLNDTKVLPARLIGVKEDTGAVIEILLLKDIQDDNWECLVKPARRVKVGTIVSFGDGKLKAKCIKELDDGIRHFELIYDGILLEILEELATRNLTVISKEVDNVGIIIDLMYEILNIIVRQHPYLLGKAKRIVDFLELNNEWLVTEPSDNLPARTEFNKTLQLYTDAEKIKQMHQQRS